MTGVGGVPATCSCGSVRDFAAQAPQKPEDDDTYELLPPGCSLADPTYGRSFGRDGKDRSVARACLRAPERLQTLPRQWICVLDAREFLVQP